MGPAISSLLEGAVAADATEQVHLQAMVRLAAQADCTHRSCYVPGHFTASAFVLSPDGRQLLLIHHSKLHRWLQPGGHVDPSDRNLEEAARREVAEEVALTDLTLLGPVPFDLDVHRIPARKQEPAHWHFDVRFLFRASHLEARAGSDAWAFRWVALGAVRELESDASVMRAVEKIGALSAPGGSSRARR